MSRPNWTSWLVLLIVVLAATPTSAQVIGTFRWRTEPYCNVLYVTVTQNGGVYTLNGYDEPCGGSPRLPLSGVAVPQTNGTITFGLSVMNVPGGAPTTLDLSINLPTLHGTWRDPSGLTGPLTFAPTSVAGAPRPLRPAGGPLAWGRVRGFNQVPTVTGSSNVAGVTRSAVGATSGNYCVSFNPPLPADRLAAAVVTTVYGSTYPYPVVTTFYCPAGTLGVLLHIANGLGQAQNGDFNFIVP